MKYTLALLSLFLVSCSQPNSKQAAVTPEKPMDTSKYAVFKFNAVRDSAFFEKGSTPASLSATEIDSIETIIAKRVTEYNNKTAKPFLEELKKESPDFIPINVVIEHPEKYLKQFITVTNPKGEKVVWVNCFYNYDNQYKRNWKNQLVFAQGGGAWYFYVMINLSTNTIIQFNVNGYL